MILQPSSSAGHRRARRHVRAGRLLPHRQSLGLPATVAVLALTVMLSMKLIGFLMLTVRHEAISQILGLLVLENGIFLGAQILVPGMPLLIEIVILFDLLIVVACFGVLVHYLVTHVGTHQQPRSQAAGGLTMVGRSFSLMSRLGGAAIVLPDPQRARLRKRLTLTASAVVFRCRIPLPVSSGTGYHVLGELHHPRSDRRLGDPVHGDRLSARLDLCRRLHAPARRRRTPAGFYALFAGFGLTTLFGPLMNNAGLYWIAIELTTLGQHLPGRVRARGGKHRGGVEIHHHRLRRHQPGIARHRAVLLGRQLRARPDL